MKSKINYYELGDIEVTGGMVKLLMKLKVPSAEKCLKELKDDMCQFCADCYSHEDFCLCYEDVFSYKFDAI